MIFGHLGCSYLVSKKIFQTDNWLVLASCLVGGYFPDLVDKPLALLGVSQGRGYGHSLSVFLGLWLMSRFLVKGYRRYANAFLSCLMLHNLCDFVKYQVLFWPLFGPIGLPEQGYSMSQVVYRFYTLQSNIPLAIFDLGLCLIAIFVWIREGLVSGSRS